MLLRRTLGQFDVALFFLIACTNLQWVATAAVAGPSSLPVWILGAAAMFVPVAVVVMHLSRLYPEEGGMYVWSKRALGPFAGFMLGWTYWCTNLPYFPALLYFMAGNALFIGGSRGGELAGSPAYYLAFSLTGFAAATALNVVGLDVGKWLNNAGAIARFAVTLLLVGLAAAAIARAGSATPITMQTIRPGLHVKDLIFWSIIAFAWTGPEGIPFVAGEVKDAARAIPRGLALAIPAIAAVYVLGTAGVLVLVDSNHVSAIYGFMQAVGNAGAMFHARSLTTAAAILVTLSCLGSVGAWLGIAARIPFVAGIERYLPSAFARVHPRWGSPYVAIGAQAAISVLFILLGQGGTTVKGAYDVLVSATVLITMVPFLLLFTSAIKLTRSPAIVAAALVGLLTTAFALVLSAFPAEDDPNKPLAVAKVLLLTAITLGLGVIFYAGARRKQPHVNV